MKKWYGGDRYLPEPVRFAAMTDEEKVWAARLTARFVARWATRYEAFPVDRSTVRLGELPRVHNRRAAVIDESFDWLRELLVARGLTILWVGLVLYHRGGVALDQHDGVPAHLFLTSEQFARLQEEWRRHGLPEDLYYPADAQRVVTKPIEVFGGLVLGKHHLSPLEFARGEAAPPVDVRLPSDEEREQALADAGLKFTGALERRRAELTKGVGKHAQDELATVEMIERLVGSLILGMSERARRRRTSVGESS